MKVRWQRPQQRQKEKHHRRPEQEQLLQRQGQHGNEESNKKHARRYLQVIGSTAFGFIIAMVTVIVETMDPQVGSFIPPKMLSAMVDTTLQTSLVW